MTLSSASSQGQRRFSADKPLTVVATMTAWHEPPRIRHQVTRQLQRYYNVLYVELAFDSAQRGETLERISDDLLVYRPQACGSLTRRLRHHLEYFRREFNDACVRRIEPTIRELGYERAVLVSFQYDFPEIMRSAMFRRRIYFCNDDFQTGQRPWAKRMKLRAEHEVIGGADLSLAVSVPLVEKLRASSPNAELFLPGHEFEAKRRVTALRERTQPIRVCYMGFINSRLRIDWLEALADAGMDLTLVGPLEQDELFAKLLAHGNVRHLGSLVGEQLYATMSGCDVFVMPYDVTQPAVRAITAPNKLFQYLACGRPVVCSNLPSLLKLPEKFLYVAADAEQFVNAARAAFEEDTVALATSRLDFAAENTWTARGDHLHRLIEQTPAAGGAYIHSIKVAVN
jgi:glycosyltransferase involved in cell wall biosynthesis